MAVDSETLARFRLIPRAVEEGDNDDEEDDDAADDCKKAWAKAPPARACADQSKVSAGGRAAASWRALTTGASSASQPQSTTSGPGAPS